MSMTPVSDKELQLDVDAYYQAGGNKSEAARARGFKRQTYNSRLEAAEVRFEMTLGKVADGRVDAPVAKQRPLPRKGYVKHYLLTSIQNNTHLHDGFKSLVRYSEWLDALPKASCELLVGTYSYQLAAYGSKAVKRGKVKGNRFEELWYAPDAEPFIVDESIELAPGIIWCGEQNVMPTAKHPLTSFETYNGRNSNIVPHAKIAMASVASMADEATKFNYTTGTVTLRNYIQKRAGILAEQEHSYGACIVSVDSGGNWFVRQLGIDTDNTIMDVGPDGVGGVSIRFDEVREEPVVASIYWGDAHASELELWVRELAWGKDGMLDATKATFQFAGDIYSMRSRGHHEMKDFHRMYQKHMDGEEIVEDELQLTADLAVEMGRDWCETVIVPSNHDRHLERWLNETDYRHDPINAKLFLELQWQTLDAIDRSDKDFNVLEYALKKRGVADDVRFLALDESFLVAGVENGLHGDLGPNGSRGSTRALTKLGRDVNKGHDHQAAISGGVYSAGACSLNFPYMKGPTAHSISHIVTYDNGQRTIVTMWGHRWRI